MLKNNKQKKVFFYTPGDCPRRNMDAARILEYFKKNNWQITQNTGEADLVLCNTCAFCKEKEDQSIRKIWLLNRRKRKNAPLVVCGCLPGINKERLDSVHRGLVFGPAELEKLDQIINARIK